MDDDLAPPQPKAPDHEPQAFSGEVDASHESQNKSGASPRI